MSFKRTLGTNGLSRVNKYDLPYKVTMQFIVHTHAGVSKEVKHEHVDIHACPVNGGYTCCLSRCVFILLAICLRRIVSLLLDDRLSDYQ